MKLIIDIPKEVYKFIKDRGHLPYSVSLANAIKDGEILPERKFIRIITTYHPDDSICYEEYKGKPYFSIEYQENGETFVGYGTYNPDVLSRYLRDYFCA